jgi:hypothetical protein
MRVVGIICIVFFFFFFLMGFFINKLFAVVMGNLFCRGMHKKEIRKI